MAVDDAELLALAGGDSSSDEETVQHTVTHRNANSPLPSIEVSQPSGARPSSSKSKMSPIPQARSGSSQAKVRKTHDSEEEGEA